MENETESVVAFIRQRAAMNRAKAAEPGNPHGDDCRLCAVEFDALAGDIAAGLHKA